MLLPQLFCHFLIPGYLNSSQEKHWEEGVKMKLGDNKFILVSSALSPTWL